MENKFSPACNLIMSILDINYCYIRYQFGNSSVCETFSGFGLGSLPSSEKVAPGENPDLTLPRAKYMNVPENNFYQNVFKD